MSPDYRISILIVIVILTLLVIVFQAKLKKTRIILSSIITIIATVLLAIIGDSFSNAIGPLLPQVGIFTSPTPLIDNHISSDSDKTSSINEKEEEIIIVSPTPSNSPTPTNMDEPDDSVVTPSHIEDSVTPDSIVTLLASGSVSENEKVLNYTYTATVDGTYRFDTDRSAGGNVRVRISGENGNSLDSGINGLTIDLEANKNYNLSVEYYDAPCDYSVSIGIPIAISDVSEKDSVSGCIAYKDQRDRYYYTAPTSGTYRLDTDLSSGGQVRIRISGENGNSLDSGHNGLTIDLEEGKTYILSVEFYDAPCDYTVNIGIPKSIDDITGSSSLSGSITYQDQKDRYYYTAPTSGTYRFDTDLSAGGQVRIRISGENGSSLNSNYNGLSIDLEEGKNYILSVEYVNAPCDYTVSIGIPKAIDDITGSSSVSGSITYQDQKDQHYFTAPTTGTYQFEASLSTGGSVCIRISGENGISLCSSINNLAIDLEEGKQYILGIEYYRSPCDYTISISPN